MSLDFFPVIKVNIKLVGFMPFSFNKLEIKSLILSLQSYNEELRVVFVTLTYSHLNRIFPFIFLIAVTRQLHSYILQVNCLRCQIFFFPQFFVLQKD